MANIKLGESIYENVHSVNMETESGDSAVFPRYVIGEPIEAMLYLDNWNGTTYNIKLENYKIFHPHNYRVNQKSTFHNLFVL